MVVSQVQHLGGAEQYLLTLIRYCQADLGWTASAEDVATILAATEVFVHRTFSENMSLSVIEVVAAGLPIVGGDVGGVGEIIRNGHDGLLVRPVQADELARKILYLAEATGDISVARHGSFCPLISL